MTMGLLEQQLADCLNKEIVVVQNDGKAFKGTLRHYDAEFLLLTDTLETSVKEVRWRPVTVPTVQPGARRKVTTYDPGATVAAGAASQMAVLSTVMINVHGVLRIWLWDPKPYESKELGEISAVSF